MKKARTVIKALLWAVFVIVIATISIGAVSNSTHLTAAGSVREAGQGMA